MQSRIDPIEPGDADDEATNELLREATEIYDDSAYALVKEIVGRDGIVHPGFVGQSFQSETPAIWLPYC